MSYTFELNNARKDADFASGKINAKSAVVEIFSAIVNGEDLSRFGKKADVAANYIKDLAQKASNNDFGAMAELNEIRKFAIQPRLLQEIKLLSVFGSYQQLGWNETPELTKIKFENVRADIQAEGQDVSTPFYRREKVALAPITISAGHKVNYRELALGDATTEYALQEEVRKAIRNKAALYVVSTVYNAIAHAHGVKYFYENAGLTKTDVDALLMKVRRYGKPTVLADYAVLAQFLPWIGYAGTIGNNAITGVSQRLLDEIADNGIVGSYNGAILQEIENGYDFSSVVTDAKGDKNYKTLLPAGLGFVTPVAPITGVSPVQTFTIGGLTSFTGNSVTTGEILTRFDLAVACGVADASAIGVINDTNLSGDFSTL